eukprot:GAFH01000475.1.p4 GENE.GAFH01000475.1~~GAFH01000475.1.p4  ORF type:complete len:88 (-),score=22.87 GAFH01000475.1:162-392(-)
MGLPKKTSLDWEVVVGPIIFGIGWGVGGICPAPGFVNIAGINAQPILVWIASLIGGMYLWKFFDRTRAFLAKKQAP